MASIGNFFRRSLRRPGRRGEGREGTPGSAAPRRGLPVAVPGPVAVLTAVPGPMLVPGPVAVPEAVPISVAVPGPMPVPAPGAAAAGPDGCRRSGDFPGQRSAATPVGRTGRGRAPAPARSPLALPVRAHPAELGPSVPGDCSISRGLLHPQGLTPARELHPMPWEPSRSQMNPQTPIPRVGFPIPWGFTPSQGQPHRLPITTSPKAIFPPCAASQGTLERGMAGKAATRALARARTCQDWPAMQGTVPPRQVGVVEPLEDDAEIGLLGFVSFSEIQGGSSGVFLPARSQATAEQVVATCGFGGGGSLQDPPLGSV